MMGHAKSISVVSSYGRSEAGLLAFVADQGSHTFSHHLITNATRPSTVTLASQIANIQPSRCQSGRS